MAGSTKARPRTNANTHGKAITVTDRTSEILRRISFARKLPVKVLLEELTEAWVNEAKSASRDALPELSYLHESE
jgi:hypothetical protein